MKMKKLLLLVALSSVLAFSSFAYKDVYEPENDDAVSFSTYSVEKQSTEVVFTKYAKADGNDDYWVRLSRRQNGEKILHYIFLNIDGVNYRITAMVPTYEQAMTAQTTIDKQSSSIFGIMPIARTAFRYYPISPELVTKISTAKSIYILYSRFNRLNMKFDIPSDFLAEIQKNFKLEFKDFPKYWHPELAGNGSENETYKTLESVGVFTK